MGGGTMPIIHVRHSSSSSSSSSSNNLPVPSSSSVQVGPITPSCTGSYCFCDSGSETCRKQVQNKRASRTSLLSSVFGPVPSRFEVENAILALLSFLQGITSSSHSELQWLQPILDSCVTRKLLSYGHGKVYDAFQSLQTDPSVKRMVVSLSSDRALWDAVTNNELVKKLREPPSSDLSVCGNEGLLPQSSNQEPEFAKRVMRWIMDITRAKVMELIEQFQSLVTDIFLPPETLQEKNPTANDKDQFEEKVRSSLLLTVVILLIVVVARLRGA
ncbi:hypothetical protein D8674_030809 [Pyrus ussuriensis x Pyrus communis]|uniref:Uncharacterized protein n=1 Tax=Pyrus ussuriensis x Pyrus communis TaxID=2448454 RepID=A0A5N5EWP1_9ROSA|nr:hypothetical protein D8674_030809 [Pyrus ussuriensis x Pyrus communis]